jgi:periplasmic protein TonB
VDSINSKISIYSKKYLLLDIMKLPLIPILVGHILIFNPSHAHAQEIQDGYYFLDADEHPVKEEKATVILHVTSVGDSCKQFNYYHILGPLLRTETYKQGSYTLPQGFFAWYDGWGRVDSTGYYDHGLPDKSWYYMDDNCAVTRLKTYDRGTLMKDTLYSMPQNLMLKKNLKDSMGDSSQVVDVESVFPGGPPAWLQYLNHTERYPDRAINNYIQGEVRIYFSIDTAGGVHNPILYKSVEVSIDEQALSVIKNSPDWIPGSQNGHKVKTFKIQPIVYKMEK